MPARICWAKTCEDIGRTRAAAGFPLAPLEPDGTLAGLEMPQAELLDAIPEGGPLDVQEDSGL